VPEFLLPCANQGVRTRCIILVEQVVITDVEGYLFSVRFIIAERRPPRFETFFDTADKIVEFQSPDRLSEVLRLRRV